MKALHGWAAAAFLCVLQYSWAEGARDDGEVNKKVKSASPRGSLFSQEYDDDLPVTRALPSGRSRVSNTMINTARTDDE